ncbi:MAG: tetratricopeptide repeat protein [Planctomycetota bacterium]|jgi:tetratricopeptide (TPR) repeat protein|nr:tetratricopeptide repeat protein [Planctomycetota bacterium]
MRQSCFILCLAVFSTCLSEDGKSAEDRSKEEIQKRLGATKKLKARVSVLRKEGKFARAIPLAEAVLATQQRLLGSNNLEVADSLNSLGELYHSTGMFKRAFPLFQQALKVREKFQGKEHADVLRTQTNIADLLARSGKLEAAQKLFEKCIELEIRIKGPETAGIAANLESIGFIHQEFGEYEKAVDFMKRSLAMRQKTIGGEHRNVALGMSNLAVAYEASGNEAEAIRLQEFALRMRRKLLGEEHFEVGESLIHLAYLYQIQEQFKKALDACEQAFSIQKKKLPEGHPLLAASLDLQANLHLVLGSAERAQLLAESALAMRREVYGSEHSEIASSLRTLGLIYAKKGKGDKAADLHERALAMRRTLVGSDSPEALESLDDLVVLYEELGHYKKALPHCIAGVKLSNEHLKDDLAERMSRQDALGRLYEATGDYRNALYAFRDSLIFSRKIHGNKGPVLAAHLEQIARVHSAMGNREDALKLQKEALLLKKDLFEEGNPELATNLVSVASLHESTGKFQEALTQYKKAYALLKKEHKESHPKVVEVMTRMARLFEELGDLNEALRLTATILKIQKNELGEEHLKIAELLNQTGSLYRKLKKVDKALVAFQAALNIRKKLLGNEHIDVGTSMNNLGSLVQAMGDPFSARQLYESALKIFKRHLGEDHPQLITLQNNLAILLGGLGDRLGAKELLRSSMLIEEGVAYDLIDVLPQPLKLDFTDNMETTANIFFSLLLTSSVALRENNSNKLIEFAWQRKNLLADFALPKRDADISYESDEARFFAEELKTARNTLSELTFSPQPQLKGRQLSLRRKEQKLEIQRLEVELSRKSASFAGQRKVEVARARDIQEVLPDDGALVEFYTIRWCDFDRQRFKGQHIVGLSLSKSRGVRIVDVGDIKKLTGLIADFRKELSEPDSKKNTALLTGSGRRLFDKLIAPFKFRLDGIRKIYIAPTDALNLLPFEALSTTAVKFLGDEYEVSYVTTGPDLLTREKTPQAGRPALFIDPEFDGIIVPGEPKPRTVFPRLKDGASEFEKFSTFFEKRLYSKANAFSGINASELNLKKLQAGRVLHLCTHSYVISAPVNEEELTPGQLPGERRKAVSGLFRRTGLALSGANRRPQTGLEDGRLNAVEISRLNLKGTDLVVLSRNETDIANQNAGLAAYAITRAFQIAGAPSVMRSLWKVPVDVRQRILEQFYYNYYQRGLPPDSALKKARRSLRDYKEPGKDGYPYDHPFYWAAYVLVRRGRN